MADVKALEHPTLKVPYEILNKRFRAAQKTADREISHVNGASTELEARLQIKPTTVADVTHLLDGVVEKLQVLKRKAEEAIQEELDAARVIKKRIEHLRQYDDKNVNGCIQWKKKRLDRMLVEYFLRSGYYESAIRLARHSGIEELTNIELFLISKEVEESLARKETGRCLSWCHDNKSKLRKMKQLTCMRTSPYNYSTSFANLPAFQSSLEFNLRTQEFIELVRDGQRLEAIGHAKKYFVNLDEEQLPDVQRVMGLLAFPTDTTVPQYQELFDESRWYKLIEQFRNENYKLYQLNSYSIFTVTLQAGLSALKTPHCYKDGDDTRNTDCPVCSKYLNELARALPYAHCSQSRLVCFISGQPLNEHNPPMMLPNGYVYGENALLTMAAESEGIITCPRTKETFDIKLAEKVYVM